MRKRERDRGRTYLKEEGRKEGGRERTTISQGGSQVAAAANSLPTNSRASVVFPGKSRMETLYISELDKIKICARIHAPFHVVAIHITSSAVTNRCSLRRQSLRTSELRRLTDWRRTVSRTIHRKRGRCERIRRGGDREQQRRMHFSCQTSSARTCRI